VDEYVRRCISRADAGSRKMLMRKMLAAHQKEHTPFFGVQVDESEIQGVPAGRGTHSTIPGIPRASK
jgi:hypothetical protein